MSEPFVAEIRMFGGNFAPRGWALCDGQLLAVSQNDALFSLIGNIYGGDGETTFGLPDLRGRLAVHAGSGPGLSPRQLGAKGGSENVTITSNEMPSHTHPVRASSQGGMSTSPVGNYPASVPLTARYQNVDAGSAGSVSMETTDSVGGNRSHTNLAPALCVNYIIALFGIYPSRN
ncbi:MAG: tail fiber protein [Ilumatobacter fluminis]